MVPDETDWKITEILRQGYESNNQIARQLGVSEGMVRKRVQRLKEAGILKVRALINPDVLDNQQIAVIGVNVKESRLLDQKAKDISELDCVLSVSVVSGRYDLLVELLIDSNRGLVGFLTETLPQVDGISATESFLLLKSYKKYV